MATVPSKVARGAFVVLFWGMAALLVLAAHQIITLQVMAIVAAGFGYVRWTARDATLDHALFVGATWVVLDVIAEVTAAKVVGHGWFELMGSPATPLRRDLLLVTWIAAPAIFARVRA